MNSISNILNPAVSENNHYSVIVFKVIWVNLWRHAVPFIMVWVLSGNQL